MEEPYAPSVVGMCLAGKSPVPRELKLSFVSVFNCRMQCLNFHHTLESPPSGGSYHDS